jgi:hypothetical protein
MKEGYLYEDAVEQWRCFDRIPRFQAVPTCKGISLRSAQASEQGHCSAEGARYEHDQWRTGTP